MARKLPEATEVRRTRVDEGGLRRFLASLAAEHPILSNWVILCIGTDRSTGDCLGPLVGTQLQERGYANVLGTLREPCDAAWLERTPELQADGKQVLAIDACLGRPESVGCYLIANAPLIPAQAVGGKLQQYGTHSIAAVVNSNGPHPYKQLQTTSLYQVMQLADKLSAAIVQAWEPVALGRPIVSLDAREALDAQDERVGNGEIAN